MSSEHDHDPPRPDDADERAPEQDSARTAAESVEKSEAPDAIRAARASRRRGAERNSPAAEARRARGVEWVRPTDLITRHGAALVGRGIDFEVELARRTRTPIAAGARGLGERARRLPPVSAFGRSSAGEAAASRPGVGMT